RKAFQELEQGDLEAVTLWKWFREESLKEFNRIYDLMGITFDSTNGEAFYNDKMQRVIKMLEEKDLLVESNGAMVVELGEDLPPCLIKKKDGASLYATRDLAAAIYRYETYGFRESLYVV
ncbi:arginine--tRNA ligase, partial [Micrococcus sp. SIMBA_131]